MVALLLKKYDFYSQAKNQIYFDEIKQKSELF